MTNNNENMLPKDLFAMKMIMIGNQGSWSVEFSCRKCIAEYTLLMYAASASSKKKP